MENDGTVEVVARGEGLEEKTGAFETQVLPICKNICPHRHPEKA